MVAPTRTEPAPLPLSPAAEGEADAVSALLGAPWVTGTVALVVVTCEVTPARVSVADCEGEAAPDLSEESTAVPPEDPVT